jgi:hypothetical protein
MDDMQQYPQAAAQAPQGDAPQGLPPSASKGEFVSQGASPIARKFIAKGRLVLYDPKMKDAVRAAFEGTQSLADGIAAFVVQMMHKLEENMGQLGQTDYSMVVAHLVGSMVDMARTLQEPDAVNNTAQVTTDAVHKVLEMDSQDDPQNEQNQDQPPQGAEQPPPDQPQQPLAQFGAPQ